MPGTAKTKLPRHWSDCKTEAEEAAWWDKHGSREFLKAVKKGELRRSTPTQLMKEIRNAQKEVKRKQPARLLSLRLPEELIDKAKAKAETAGIPYQVLMRSILHKGLTK